MSQLFAHHAVAHTTEKLQFEQSRESDYTEFLHSTVTPFWQSQAKAGQFKNDQGLDIHYAYVPVVGAKQTIVIAPGRVEGYLKYQELIYDLVQQEFSVFIIDHQGQGFSSRRLSNRHKGYVEDFQHYIDDFHQFIQTVIKPEQEQELILLGHSMGSAIGLRYIEDYPHVFDKALFSSPMWGFLSGSVPEVVAKGVINVGNWYSDNFMAENPYFLGGRDYHKVPFAENELTSSKLRYDSFRTLYEQIPELQLGGITFSWIQQSVQALEQAYEELHKVTIPVMVLQAGADTIINNQSQSEFCQRLHELNPKLSPPQPTVIEHAKHELFIEADPIRNQVISHIIGFARPNH